MGVDEYRTIQDALYSWGRWRAAQNRTVKGYKSALVFSAPDVGVRRTTCPRCCNSTAHRADCGRCRGRGWYLERFPKIDPKIIPGKSVMGVQIDTAPDLYRLIDQTLAAFDVRRRVIVVTRYVYAPKANKRTQLLFTNRMLRELSSDPMSIEAYSRLLTDAKRRLAAIVGIPHSFAA